MPVTLLRCSAMGAAKTLQAYMEPIHKLIRQLATKTAHLLLVRYLTCSGDNSINSAP
jgi:hypothetical protein